MRNAFLHARGQALVNVGKDRKDAGKESSLYSNPQRTFLLFPYNSLAEPPRAPSFNPDAFAEQLDSQLKGNRSGASKPPLPASAAPGPSAQAAQATASAPAPAQSSSHQQPSPHTAGAPHESMVHCYFKDWHAELTYPTCGACALHVLSMCLDAQPAESVAQQSAHASSSRWHNYLSYCHFCFLGMRGGGGGGGCGDSE
eukprot:1162150-Pelagomonas_calceolata.AAC.8